jgi:hypothetical protein
MNDIRQRCCSESLGSAAVANHRRLVAGGLLTYGSGGTRMWRNWQTHWI